MQEQNSEGEEVNDTLEFQKQTLLEEMGEEELGDDQDSEPDDITSQDTRKNMDLSYQPQKIMINEAEDESPTYKNFFEKDQRKLVSESQGSPKKKDDSSPRRWQLLYDRALESREAKEEARKEQVNQNQKDDTECTFKPKLVASYTPKRSSSPEFTDNDLMLTVQERNKIWKMKSDSKLNGTRESKKDKELNNCTFIPDLAKSQQRDYNNPNLSGFSSKGIDLHLRRQIIAKQNKDEKDMIRNNPLTKLPAHVYKKEGKITIPKSPDFTKGKIMDVYSLRKPFDAFSARSLAMSTSPSKNIIQKDIQILVNPIHVKNVTFGEAIHTLHCELYKIDMEIDSD
jgi:hypothetical protein